MIFSPFMNRLNILFLFVIAYAAKASSTDIACCAATLKANSGQWIDRQGRRPSLRL